MHNNNDDQDCIRIIIADDHTIFRDGLKRLLETEPTFQVVGQAGDGHEAVQLALQVKADVLLLDVAMPKVPGLETLRELNRNQIKIRTLLLTESIERSEIRQARRLQSPGASHVRHHPQLGIAFERSFRSTWGQPPSAVRSSEARRSQRADTPVRQGAHLP